MDKTIGQLEASVCEAIIKFEKEFMGRGPLEAKAYIIDDIILVRLQGVLTPAELKLGEDVKDQNRGGRLIKQVRQELMERGRPLLEKIMQDIFAIPVRSLHTDISAKTGERIIVFTMEQLIPCRRQATPKR